MHPNAHNAEHQITSAIGSRQATAVVAGGNWVMQTVAFKAAALAPDFTINATNFAPPSVPAGTPATSTVTVAPLNGFNSSVALSCSITPVVTPPPTCAFVLDSNSGRFGHLVLTLNTSATTPAGGYTVTVSGVGGSVTRTKVLSLTVTGPWSGFHDRRSPLTPAAVAAGASSTSTITITRVNGLTDAGGSDLQRHTRSDSRAHMRIEPGLTDGRDSYLDADGQYHGCDHGVARAEIKRPHLRHAAADWRPGTAGNRVHFT